VPASIRPGDVLADRYRLVDLLSESGNGRFWRAHDRILERHVALHVIAADDDRAEGLLAAARRSATILDPHILRVLDAERSGQLCYVVNEWGSGTSLDIMLAAGGELSPRRAAWVVGEVAAACARAHAADVPHGRLNPENVLIDTSGAVRVIGWCVDAALHGRPTGRVADDVADLAGLLYAALTGRWAGPSSSAVPPAPTDHGRVLRPRQVRAGIPRDLDTLCDEVLNPQPGCGAMPAEAFRAVLEEFVGDPSGLQESMTSRLVSGAHATVVLPQVPEFTVREAEDLVRGAPAEGPAAAGSEPQGAEAQPEPAASPAPERAEETTGEVTQAELPGFLVAEGESSAPTPPPPFEEPPARPLFAPDPPEGAPVRRARHPHPGRDSQQYWPWDTEAGARTGGAGAGWVDTGWPTGTGPVVEEEVPGRSSFRVAAILLATLVVVVAVTVAFNLGRGRTPLGTVPEDESPSDTASAQATTGPLEVASVTDLDPQGSDGGEYPELTGLVVDGDPSTTWRTSTYKQDFGPGGLKDGVGLVLDLGETREVAEVALRLVGSPTDLELYVVDEPPTGVPAEEGLSPAATVSAGDQEQVSLEEPAEGRYLVVWITSLPAVSDGFRAEVAEVVPRG
jgi:hypothetical protein